MLSKISQSPTFSSGRRQFSTIWSSSSQDGPQRLLVNRGSSSLYFCKKGKFLKIKVLLMLNLRYWIWGWRRASFTTSEPMCPMKKAGLQPGAVVLLNSFYGNKGIRPKPEECESSSEGNILHPITFLQKLGCILKITAQFVNCQEQFWYYL